MSDEAYYLRREQDERDLAKAAQSFEIRAIHELLAERYAELARQVMPLPPSASTSTLLSA